MNRFLRDPRHETQIGTLAAALRWRCPWLSKSAARTLVRTEDDLPQLIRDADGSYRWRRRWKRGER